ncbi:hypothetical protein V493_01730 [Pseudogymnoascus sp. VKM F-4281 (FW-2241)]|nr:hypothetical protein V493_01730 [Pseudogymnoascus sp. VKM F-4281 (FW-2241)]
MDINQSQTSSTSNTTPRHQPLLESHCHKPPAATRYQPRRGSRQSPNFDFGVWELSSKQQQQQQHSNANIEAEAMAKMSPAEKAAVKKRQQQIKEGIYICSNFQFSEILQMEQDDLKRLMLNLGEDRPTREPGNTMRREVMNLQGAKFRAFCRYAQIWDSVAEQYEATDAAEIRLNTSEGATIENMNAAADVLTKYIKSSDPILEYGWDLLQLLNNNEALSLRQLVAAQGDATVIRQDRCYLAVEANRTTVSLIRFRANFSRPFKFCAAKYRIICRKLKKKKKGKKASACITV